MARQGAHGGRSVGAAHLAHVGVILELVVDHQVAPPAGRRSGEAVLDPHHLDLIRLDEQPEDLSHPFHGVADEHISHDVAHSVGLAAVGLGAHRDLRTRAVWLHKRCHQSRRDGE